MATVSSSSGVEQVGVVAGDVWQALQESDPISLTKLVKIVDAPRDVVMQAVGWLAREDKICLEESGRSRMISLA